MLLKNHSATLTTGIVKILSASVRRLKQGSYAKRKLSALVFAHR